MSRTPISVGDELEQAGEGGAGEHAEAGDEPDHAVALLQAVAADQVEDQEHEEDRDDRGDDPRLRGQVDLGRLGGEGQRLIAPPPRAGAGGTGRPGARRRP